MIQTEFNEKHTPRIEVNGDEVKITFGPHPMEESHYIHWVELYVVENTPRLVGRVEFSPDVEPIAVFKLKKKGKLIAIAYCNLHGLFQSEYTY